MGVFREGWNKERSRKRQRIMGYLGKGTRKSRWKGKRERWIGRERGQANELLREGGRR